jgi:hypothetical protein
MVLEAKLLGDLVREGCPGEVLSVEVIPGVVDSFLRGAAEPLMVCRFAEAAPIDECSAHAGRKLAEYLAERTGCDVVPVPSRRMGDARVTEFRCRRGYFVA